MITAVSKLRFQMQGILVPKLLDARMPVFPVLSLYLRQQSYQLLCTYAGPGKIELFKLKKRKFLWRTFSISVSYVSTFFGSSCFNFSKLAASSKIVHPGTATTLCLITV